MNIKEQLEIQKAYRNGAFQAPTLGISREDIEQMNRGDVVELLAAHGAKTTGKVSELRDRLIATMFLG